MSAVVMDNGSFLKRPWDQGGNYIPRSQYGQSEQFTPLPAISTGLSFPGSPPERSHSAHQRLPSISAAIERPGQSPSESTLKSTPQAEDPSRLPPQRGSSPHHGSTKRRRLSYDLESGHDLVKSSREPVNAQNPEGYRGHQPHSWSLPSQQDNISVHGDHTCINFDNTKHLVQDVLSGLVHLEAELRNALSGQLPKTLKQEEGGIASAPDATHLGLRPSLHWAAQLITSSTRLISELAINRAFPPITTHRSPRESSQPPSSSGAQGPPENLGWRSDPVDDPYENQLRPHLTNTPPSTQDDPATGRSASDPPSAHALRMPEYQRKVQPPSHQQYQQPGGPPGAVRSHSPHRSLSNASGAHVFTPPHGPNSSASRILPSPTSTILPSLPSPNLSHQSIPVAGGTPLTLPTLRSTDPATASHLADLQHSISKKTLAYTTLQREHDALLAAFARQRTRCETLDKKSQVSDSEINTLSEEKIRLQSLSEGLEQQVEELQRAKEEAHRQSVDNGRQYMQILSMSSKLQEQGVAVERRWKVERESWEQERGELRERIRLLEEADTVVVSGGNGSGGAPRRSRNDKAAEGTGEGGETIPESIEESDVEALKAEILRLRARCRGLEEKLDRLTGEIGRLEHVIREVEGIKGTLVSQLGFGGGGTGGGVGGGEGERDRGGQTSAAE